MNGRLNTRNLEDMKDVLMDPEAPGPDSVYWVFRGKGKNFTVLSSGVIGNEYTKTYGHYHLHGEKETYEILNGSGLLLMQKPSEDPSKLEDFKVVEVKEGDTVEVLEGYGHCLVNIGEDFLIATDSEPESAGHEYDAIRKMKGFGYYVVRVGVDWKLVPNCRYSSLPESIYIFDI